MLLSFRYKNGFLNSCNFKLNNVTKAESFILSEPNKPPQALVAVRTLATFCKIESYMKHSRYNHSQITPLTHVETLLAHQEVQDLQVNMT